jgi:uncharacterized protein HemX
MADDLKQTGKPDDSPINADQEHEVGCGSEKLGLSRRLMERVAVAAALGLSVAGTADAQAELTVQQQRMKTCNAEASQQELKGEARKDFMSNCLKGERQLTAQQQKMRTCNRQASAKELKGDEREAFMRTCLKT